ncbi:MAG: hypothetical protein LUH63_11750 [Parabacteroides sp.]|nr:hypothetical protein [Parabacteroides sp.]
MLKRIIDTAGRIIDICYAENNLVERVSLVSYDKRNETLISYRYNNAGDMVSITDALGQTTFIEYKNHLMVKKTDREGQTFYWEYDGTGTGARCIHTRGEGGYQEGWIEYHPEDGYNIVRDCMQSETVYYYEPNQLVTQIQDPLGNIKRFEYTDHAEIYREWDELDHLTGYTYDENGNRTSIVHPDGSSDSFVYDEQNRLVMAVDAEGQKRLYIYQENANLLNSIIEPDNSITSFGYDDKHLAKEIRHNENTIYLTYDNQNNLVSLCNEKGETTRWKYDYRGNLLGVQGPTNAYQSFQYDSLNRVTHINGGGNMTILKYNAYEEVLEARDNSRRVEFTYTPLGSIASRKENGVKVRFGYDRMERLLYLTNEHKERYSFTRNMRGDIIKETCFDDIQREYLRDRAGKVVKVLRPEGRWTEYEYDLNGRVIRADYSDGTWENYSYDKNGRIIGCLNQDNCITFERDKMGRVIKETYSSGLPGDEGISIESEYDIDGNRIRLTSSLGADINTTFDFQGNVREIEALNAENKEKWCAEVRRNELGLEIAKRMTGGVTIMRSYDQFGRPMPQSVYQGAANRHETYNRRYSWNVNDQLISVLNGITQGYVSYAYDAIGNLASARYEDGSYEYKMPDELGNVYRNKDHSDREYAAGGKLLRDRKWNYFYDGEGNLTLKKEKGTARYCIIELYKA